MGDVAHRPAAPGVPAHGGGVRGRSDVRPPTAAAAAPAGVFDPPDRPLAPGTLGRWDAPGVPRARAVPRVPPEALDGRRVRIDRTSGRGRPDRARHGRPHHRHDRGEPVLGQPQRRRARGDRRRARPLPDGGGDRPPRVRSSRSRARRRTGCGSGSRPTRISPPPACAGWRGSGRASTAFAHQFRNAAAAGAVILLEWVSDVRAEFPVLFGAAGFARRRSGIRRGRGVRVRGARRGDDRWECGAEPDGREACPCLRGGGGRDGRWRDVAGLPGTNRTAATD